MRLASVSLLGLALGSCGGEAFTTGSGPTSGAGGDRTTSSSSSAGGQGGAGGSAGCGPGEYVSASANGCARCDDFGELLFEPPQEQMVGPGVYQVWGRVQVDGASQRLVYAFAASSMALGDLGTVGGGPPWMGGAAITGSMINTTGNEAAPLLLPADVGVPTVAGTGLLLFSSDISGVDAIYAAPGVAGTSSPTKLGGLINEGGGSNNDVAYAYAAVPPRAYWKTNRSGSTRLVTATATSADVTEVHVTVPPACTANAVHSPWVTPKGDLLLFSYPVLDGACMPSSDVIASYYAPLAPSTGLPTGPAIAIDDVNQQLGGGAAAPSLSPDLCTLYVSGFTPETAHIYTAARR